MGEKVYKASVGACYAYEELKDCCCGPALAKQCKYGTNKPHWSGLKRNNKYGKINNKHDKCVLKLKIIKASKTVYNFKLFTPQC